METYEEPEGCSVVDSNIPDREVGSVSSDRLEARVYTSSLRQAGCVEGGLGNGVVLLVAMREAVQYQRTQTKPEGEHLQLEADGITGLSSNKWRIEDEGTIGIADDDLVDIASQGSRCSLRGARVGGVDGCPDGSLNSDHDGNDGFTGCWRDGDTTVCSSSDRSSIRGNSSTGSSGTGSLGLELCADCDSRVLEVSERVGGTILTTVDCEDHSLAAMAGGKTSGLVTEHPDGVGLEAKGVKRGYGEVLIEYSHRLL